jgi:hypothetical protein
LRPYKTLLRPVLMYGSQSLMWTTSNEQDLTVCERNVSRRIFGPVCENGFWRIRYNKRFYLLFSEQDIVRAIKIGRLRWVSHAIQCWKIILLRCSPSENQMCVEKLDGQNWDGWNRRWS